MCNSPQNREVEQTQLVRVRVRVTSYFVDDVIIIYVPRTCSTSYTFAWTCKLWSTRLSLRVDIAIKWRWKSPLLLYKMVFIPFKNENIQQKRLESTQLVTKIDHTLGCWNRIFYTYTYAYREFAQLKWRRKLHVYSTRTRTRTSTVCSTSLLKPLSTAMSCQYPKKIIML